MDLGYSSARAISDVFTSVTMNNNLVYDYFYDAFGRRRMKRDAFSNGTEFTYDLGHQLLVDQSWSDTNGVGSELDEYIWLDGRPVVAFRGKVNGTGAHVTEALESPPALACKRSACPPVAARVGHELGHLAGPMPQGTQHSSGDERTWKAIQSCATKVANEPD